MKSVSIVIPPNTIVFEEWHGSSLFGEPSILKPAYYHLRCWNSWHEYKIFGRPICFINLHVLMLLRASSKKMKYGQSGSHRLTCDLIEKDLTSQVGCIKNASDTGIESEEGEFRPISPSAVVNNVFEAPAGEQDSVAPGGKGRCSVFVKIDGNQWALVSKESGESNAAPFGMASNLRNNGKSNATHRVSNNAKKVDLFLFKAGPSSSKRVRSKSGI
ncbi:hypothetical protein L1987_20105 [Smallanthus sonchifolius]|uniref:Uncharacterized protein n=1 Tax=Smallanthus sonchifolius TaxID=185202 RepID=A0ACB9IQE9_9ASTR|nr:hypothetical protein L1987_20105 [Smallanthus sonchifolius]